MSSERDTLLKAADDEAVAMIEAAKAERQAEYDAVVAKSVRRRPCCTPPLARPHLLQLAMLPEPLCQRRGQLRFPFVPRLYLHRSRARPRLLVAANRRLCGHCQAGDLHAEPDPEDCHQGVAEQVRPAANAVVSCPHLLCQGVLHKLPVDVYSQIALPRSCCRGAVMAYLVECVSTVNTEVR